MKRFALCVLVSMGLAGLAACGDDEETLSKKIGEYVVQSAVAQEWTFVSPAVANGFTSYPADTWMRYRVKLDKKGVGVVGAYVAYPSAAGGEAVGDMLCEVSIKFQNPKDVAGFAPETRQTVERVASASTCPAIPVGTSVFVYHKTEESADGYPVRAYLWGQLASPDEAVPSPIYKGGGAYDERWAVKGNTNFWTTEPDCSGKNAQNQPYGTLTLCGMYTPPEPL